MQSLNTKGLIDCHTHTKNSPDGYDSVEEMCRRAYDSGLAAYAITDHCEINRFYPEEYYGGKARFNPEDTFDFASDFERSMTENLAAKERWDGKLKLICGIELGQATHDFASADKVADDPRLDFIIGSMHQLPGNDDFAFLPYTAKDVPNMLERYYNEVVKLCKWGKFDVLGHLTYPLRYICGEHGIEVDMKPYEELIRETFKLLIDSGKGIEINTSGYRQKYGLPFPHLPYVKLFREMGGEILSIGSDAHRVTDLGKGIREGADLALEAGFKYLCYFEQRNTIFVKL